MNETHLRIDPKEHKEIKALALKADKTIKAFVRDLITAYKRRERNER